MFLTKIWNHNFENLNIMALIIIIVCSGIVRCSKAEAQIEVENWIYPRAPKTLAEKKAELEAKKEILDKLKKAKKSDDDKKEESDEEKPESRDEEEEAEQAEKKEEEAEEEAVDENAPKRHGPEGYGFLKPIDQG